MNENPFDRVNLKRELLFFLLNNYPTFEYFQCCFHIFRLNEKKNTGTNVSKYKFLSIVYIKYKGL